MRVVGCAESTPALSTMSLDLLADLDDLDGGDDEELLETPAPAGTKRTRAEMEDANGEAEEGDDMSDEEDEAARKQDLEAALAEKLKGADDVKTVAKLLGSKGFQETLKVRSKEGFPGHTS